MANVSIRIDDAEIRKLLATMIRRGKTLRPYFTYVVGVLQIGIIKNFREQGHYGDLMKGELSDSFTKWKPLSALTLASRKARNKGDAILQDSNRLRASIGTTVRNITNTGLEYGTNVEYAAIHHFGSAGLPGGVIRPTHAAHLAIPYPGVKGSPKSYSGNTFTAGKTIYQKDKKGGYTPLFMLLDSVRIPARPFMTVSKSDIDRIHYMAANYVMGIAHLGGE